MSKNVLDCWEIGTSDQLLHSDRARFRGSLTAKEAGFVILVGVNGGGFGGLSFLCVCELAAASLLSLLRFNFLSENKFPRVWS